MELTFGVYLLGLGKVILIALGSFAVAVVAVVSILIPVMVGLTIYRNIQSRRRMYRYYKGLRGYW